MRINRTRDEWRALIEAQQLSGLNQSQFCHYHGITRSAFSNAKLRLSFIDTTPPSVFVPALPPEPLTRIAGDNTQLATAAGNSPVATLSLQLPGATLCMPDDISPRWLAILLREMAP